MKVKCLLAHTIYWLPRIVLLLALIAVSGLFAFAVGLAVYLQGWVILLEIIGKILLVVLGLATFFLCIFGVLCAYEWAENYRQKCKVEHQ